MDIKNKNIRKLWITFAIIVVIEVIIAIIISTMLIKSYRQSVYDFAARVVANVQREYPEAEEQIAKSILQQGETKSDILMRYGITPDTIELKSNMLSHGEVTALLVTTALIGMTALIMVGIIVYIKREHRKIQQMLSYTQKILEGEYDLDIRDNDETDLSVLQNQIYDITVMLKEKNVLLEVENQKIEKLIADISHQLKTPLTSLNILNSLLYEPLPPEKRAEFLTAMEKELNKIEWLIKNILNIAKMDSKTISFKKEEVPTLPMLQKCKDSFAAICELMDVDIALEDMSKDCVWLVDEKWTTEAIHNMIKNAIEHQAKNIYISCMQTPLYAQVKIQDDGEGIDKEDIHHIFDRFYKAKNSKRESMGIGLAFVKCIIEGQNGDIRVQSKKGKGTEFTIKLYQQWK